MQKSSVKYLQTEFKNTFKGSYTRIKFVSFQGYKESSTYANQDST
jgi:hypothetical protein